MAHSNEDLARKFLASVEAGDWSAVASILDGDFFMEWPQSGERFLGRENAIGAMSAQVNKPSLAGELRAIGSGDLWVLMGPLRYGDDIYQYVGVFVVVDGRIRSATEYFGAAFPAQEFRARFAQRAD